MNVNSRPELRIGSPLNAVNAVKSTLTGEANPIGNSNNSNSNNSSGLREVNVPPLFNARQAAIRQISLIPSPTCANHLEQSFLLAELYPTPGRADRNPHVFDGVKYCYKAAKDILKGVSPDSEKILDTTGIIKTMLEYAIFRFKQGKQRETLLQGALDIVKQREKVLGHVKGDGRLKHDVKVWMKYVKGRGPKPGTRRMNKKRGTRRG